jgi:hypothetical protein
MGRTANIIIASSNGDQLAELINGANEIAQALKGEYDVSPRVATSIDDIRRKRNPDTLLLIIAASVPQSRSSSDEDEQPALEFVGSVADEQQALPCILVSDRYEHYRLAQRLNYCELLVVDSTTNYVDDCLRLARKLGVVREASTPPAPATPKYALIEVDLPADLNRATVCLDTHEGKIRPEALGLRKCDVGRLVKECRELKRKLSAWEADPEWYYQHWQSEYRRLGARFGRLLWNTQSFTTCHATGTSRAGPNVRVRFTLEKPWFDGLWEAMQVRGGRDFLMLDNTIARRMPQKGRFEASSAPVGEIAAQQGSLKILVIKSNVDNAIPESPDDPLWKKYWSKHGGILRKLDHLDDEVDAMQRAISDAARRRGKTPHASVTVDVLPTANHAGGAPWSLAEDTRTALETQCYDIVHFAGHAFFADDGKGGGRGWLVFSGHPRPRAVSIATVATWLAKAGVQLAYLSCCRSSAALAALEFARNNIPMVIGFHWDVEDKRAPAFAREFYTELLNSHLKVCPAISKARRNLFDGSHGSDPIWASPVLIAQPTEWIQVEAVLSLTAAEPMAAREAAREPDWHLAVA